MRGPGMSSMTPQEIVSELDRHIVGQQPGQAGRGHRHAQPLAAPAGRREAAWRDHAQEHPDDRPHRRRQDRDRAPPGQAGRCALHQGRGDQVHRGGLCRQGRGLDHPRPDRHRRQAGARVADAAASAARAEDAAEERVLDVLVPGSDADNATRQAMRKRLREGTMDDKEIELDLLEPKPTMEILARWAVARAWRTWPNS